MTSPSHHRYNDDISYGVHYKDSHKNDTSNIPKYDLINRRPKEQKTKANGIYGYSVNEPTRQQQRTSPGNART